MKLELQGLNKKERNILRKILGPQKITDGTWKRRNNRDLYKYTENDGDNAENKIEMQWISIENGRNVTAQTDI